MVFIPAKGNSERVPNKNLRLLGNRTLIQRAIDFADTAADVSRIVVSTDSLMVVEACPPFQHMVNKFRNLNEGETLTFDKWVLHKRYSRDALASSKTIDGILDYFTTCNDLDDDFLLLQPTSPFRSNTEWQEIKQTFKQGRNSVFSVSAATSPHPLKTFQIRGNLTAVLTEEQILNLGRPAQELGLYYASDGAYYLIKTRDLLQSHRFVDSNSQVYVRNGIKTINIDTEEDLAFAEYVAKKYNL